MDNAQSDHPLPTFKPVTENAIKSIKQRRLTRYWEQLRGNYLLPLWSHVETEELAPSRDNLCTVEIHRGGPTLRYRIREHGDRLTEYYGSACAGRYLDDFMTPAALAALSAIYAQAVEGKRPVYTVSPFVDSKSRAVTLERLLLPFTTSGSSVELILTSLEAISIEGAFENFKVLEPSQRKAVAGFHGVIEPLSAV